MGHLVVDQFGQRTERLPALARLGSGRGFGGQTERFQHATHHLRERPNTVGIARRCSFGGALQGNQRLADLLAGEETLAAAHLIGNAGLGERLLVDLRLRVDPVQHGDLGRRDAVVDQPGDGLGDCRGLGDLVGMLPESRRRAGFALADQLQLAAGHPSTCGGDHPVGQRHHLGRGPVVPFRRTSAASGNRRVKSSR